MLYDIKKEICLRIKESRLIIDVNYDQLKTIKKANDKLREINSFIDESKSVICTRKGELTKMGLLKDLTDKYNELIITANKLGGNFEQVKLFKCKAVDAESKVAAVEAFIATVNSKEDKTTTKEEKKVMAKKDKAGKKTENNSTPSIVVSYGHWQVLQMFKKDEMKLEKLNEVYKKETEKERGLGLILSQMVKKGYVEQYEEESVKIVELTKEGKAAKATKEPEKPVVKPKTAVKPPFEAPYSEEQISEAKKKKAKKMKAANEEAFKKYEKETAGMKEPRATNNYDGKIAIGRHQEELTAKASMRDKSKAAAKDYFEANVTTDILMKKADYITALEKHGLTKTTAVAIWKECTAEGCNEERLAIANARGAGVVLPELETKNKKDKKMKDKKKDKKKDKNEKQVEEPKKDKKKDKGEKPEKSKKDKSGKDKKKDKKKK